MAHQSPGIYLQDATIWDAQCRAIRAMLFGTGIQYNFANEARRYGVPLSTARRCARSTRR
jgi:hypothetical protein